MEDVEDGHAQPTDIKMPVDADVFVADLCLDMKTAPSGNGGGGGGGKDEAVECPVASISFHRQRGLRVTFKGKDGNLVVTKGPGWHRFFHINVLMPGTTFDKVLTRDPDEYLADVSDALGVDLTMCQVDTARETVTHVWTKHMRVCGTEYIHARTRPLLNVG